MKHKVLLSSIKVPAGNRTYFFDIKQSGEEGRYIEIIKNLRLSTGEFERQSIKIFEPEIRKVVNGFIEIVINFFSADKLPVSRSKMELTKSKHENAYNPWTESDDLKLTELYCQGKKAKELALFFQRNTGAIKSRIKKLGLIEKHG